MDQLSEISQAGRMDQLVTPLGDNKLALRSFTGSEGMGENFEFFIDAVSIEENIDFDPALGRACTIKLNIVDEQERLFNGILTHAQWVGSVDRHLYHYRLVLRPWFWLLHHRADCRIFLDKDVTEIIDKVFGDAGFTSGIDYNLPAEQFDKIPYCVQYRETDLSFAMRLMEKYGIYYFYEHSEQQHTMVMATSRSSHKQIEAFKNSGLSFRGSTVSQKDRNQRLTEWISDRRFRSGKVAVNDYDYLQPPKNLKAFREGIENYNHSKYEVYDYPGKYSEQSKGEDIAKFRLEAEQALDHRRFSGGNAASLFPGGLVQIKGVTNIKGELVASENREYLVVRTGHQFGTQQYRTAGGHAPDLVYIGTCEFQPSDRPFRMLPLTQKPRIHGIQTATVVGRKGEEKEEISTDEHGHIWVQFHWDREPKVSCPVRIAQSWAGKTWGGMFIPRVGMEVVVEFPEGDPDRPLVTGCVYNGTHKVPWDLPKHKTQSGWKTGSSKDDRGYNEIQFEDTKDGEWISVHAEKDLKVVVNNNETRTIGYDLSTTITNSEKCTIGKKFKQPTGSNSRETTIEHGDDKLDIKTGAAYTEAKVKIELKVGTSKITIDPTGITLDAPTITIKAATLCTIQGLPVKIN